MSNISRVLTLLPPDVRSAFDEHLREHAYGNLAAALVWLTAQGYPNLSRSAVGRYVVGLREADAKAPGGKATPGQVRAAMRARSSPPGSPADSAGAVGAAGADLLAELRDLNGRQREVIERLHQVAAAKAEKAEKEATPS